MLGMTNLVRLAIHQRPPGPVKYSRSLSLPRGFSLISSPIDRVLKFWLRFPRGSTGKAQRPQVLHKGGGFLYCGGAGAWGRVLAAKT